MNRNQVILILIGILIFGLALRLSPLATSGGLLREPDSYYYYSIMLHANGTRLPNLSPLDSQPPAEAIGLYELTLIPHALTGIPIYTILLWIAPLFGVLIILLTFIFTDQIFANKNMALIAAFLVAVLPAGITYQLSGAYRGDSFIGAFCLLALIFLLQTLKSEGKTRKIIYSTLSAFFIILSVLLWSGGTFVPAIFILATLGIVVYYAILDRKGIRNIAYPMLTIAISAIVYLSLLHYGIITTTTSVATVPSISTATGGNAFIQETQSPNFSYVLSAFGFLSVLGPGIFLSFASLGAILTTLIMIAVISAIYGASTFLLKKDTSLKEKALLSIPLLSYLFITFYLDVNQVRFIGLSIIPIAIFMAYFISIILDFTKPIQKIIVPFIILIILFSGIVFIATYSPADSITPQFASALNWLKANSPANSIILTTWPDGSVVEGIANRSVYIDSVMADPYGYEISTSKWFTTNETSLLFNQTPDYVLIRSLTLNQSISLCGIAGINASYCNKLNNQTFLKNTEPNAYWLWNSCNSIDCHTSRGNASYFLEYSANGTKLFLIDTH